MASPISTNIKAKTRFCHFDISTKSSHIESQNSPCNHIFIQVFQQFEPPHSQAFPTINGLHPLLSWRSPILSKKWHFVKKLAVKSFSAEILVSSEPLLTNIGSAQNMLMSFPMSITHWLQKFPSSLRFVNEL